MDSLHNDAALPADDLSALAWVQDELRRSLDAAHKALNRALKDQASASQSDVGAIDPSVLRTARQQIHQGVGALELAGLPAGAALLRASEALVLKFVNRPACLVSDAVRDIERASFALLEYMARRLSCKQVSAVELFPVYEALVSRAGGALPRPSDLWAQDWPSLSLESRLEAPEGIEPRQPDAGTVDAFERGLLGLMKQPQPQDARDLAQVCAALARDAELRRAHRETATWMLASGFFEGLAGSHIALDVHAKRVLSSLLIQLRMLLRGSGVLSDRLANELLFFCAQAQSAPDSQGSVLARVRRTFGLDRHAPVDLTSSSLGRHDPAVIAQAIKRLAGAKEGWSAVAGGETLRLGGLSEQFSLMGDSLRRLFPDGEPLAAAMSDAVHRTVMSAQSPHTGLAMELATSLLYLEACLEDGQFDSPAQRERMQRLAERIRLLSEGQEAPPLEGWMEGLYRRVSDRQTMGGVVQELRATLSEIEKQLDQFFREPNDRTPLVHLPSRLKSVRGVLALLGLDLAAHASVRMGEDVDVLLHPQTDLDAAAELNVFDRLASNMGALGFLIDMMGSQPALAKSLFTYDEVSGVLSPLMGRGKKVSSSSDDPVEAAAHHVQRVEKQQAQAVAEEVAQALAQVDQEGGAALAAVSSQLQKLVDTPHVQDQTELVDDLLAARVALDQALKLDDLASAIAVREHVGQVIADLAQPEIEPESPAVPTQTLLVPSAAVEVASTGLEDDDEMRGVFLDEAREVIQDALASLKYLCSQPSDVQALTSVRRAFHTLKGSSRMVGLKDYGDAGWACEQLYNTWLGSQAPASEDLLAVTEEVLEHFSHWTEAVAERRDAAWTSEPVVAVVDALRLHGVRRSLSELGTPDEGEHVAALQAPAPMDEEPVELTFCDEQTKVIGDLRISIPLFNIYLNEADEQSRRLFTLLGEWVLEGAAHPVSDEMVALAHSLAGNSATVGYADLSKLARLLEHALSRAQARGRVSQAQAALFNEAADEIRRLLHQFAAGFLRQASPGLLARFDEHDNEASQPIEASGFHPLPADEPPEQSERRHLKLVHPEPLHPPASPPAPAPAPALAPLAEVKLSWDDEDEIDQLDQVDEDLFPVFEEEAHELLYQLASEVRRWVDKPEDAGAAAACMRTLHTFKGGARLAGAMRLGEMAHRLESAIDRQVAAGCASIELLTPLQARVDRLIDDFEALKRGDAAQQDQVNAKSWAPQSGMAPSGGVVDALMAPSELAAGVQESDPVAQSKNTIEAAPPGSALTSIDWSVLPADRLAAMRPVPRDNIQGPSQAAVRVRPQLLDRLVNQAGEVAITRSRLQGQVKNIKNSLSDLTENLDRLRQQLRDIDLQAETQMSTSMEQARAASREFDPLEFDRYTRFQELTRMMAESVNDVATVQRSLQRSLETTEDQLAAQARLTRDLQDDLLRTRMVEFEGLSDRLYRVVRLAAKETGKQVRLDIVGGNTEVDRGVLERMVASFEHLLRNCVTHGIEAPAARTSAGKDATGTIAVSISQEGNEVSIAFSDDGAGLNIERIKARALSQGVVSPGEQLSDADWAQFVFTPGFSTAEQVTELAGRGVGLDVVRAEANAMGGRIEIQTEPGQGSCFTLILPLTTAVTRVVMLRCGQVNVAVPTHLIELIRRSTPAEVEQGYIEGSMPFGDQVLPFYWLGSLLDLSPMGREGARSLSVVIVRSAQQRIALHVDEVLGNQEVVVKNLGSQLSRMPGLAGMTLLASGAVALIYNPVALAAVYGDHARALTTKALATAGGPTAGWLHPQVKSVVRREQSAPESGVPLILVVDDSLTVRRVTHRLLAREGYRINLAKDGVDALESLARERPAVVLSDIEMPRMDGFDLVRHIRADKALATLPVIVITSRIAQKHRDYAHDLGVDHYLGKPYREEELLSLVARYAETSDIDLS